MPTDMYCFQSTVIQSYYIGTLHVWLSLLPNCLLRENITFPDSRPSAWSIRVPVVPDTTVEGGVRFWVRSIIVIQSYKENLALYARVIIPIAELSFAGKYYISGFPPVSLINQSASCPRRHRGGRGSIPGLNRESWWAALPVGMSVTDGGEI